MGRFRKIHRGVVVELEGLRRPRATLPLDLYVKLRSRDTDHRRWMLRCGGSVGPAPGTHRGYWRTRVGTVRGHNVRIGPSMSPYCLTLLAHWRSPKAQVTL